MSKPTSQSRFAKRSLGQNFLADPHYVRKITEAVNPSGNDTIIEIGPGRGALTDRLVASGANIIAIELDRELVPLLRARFADNLNFQIIEADVVTIDFLELLFTNPQSAIRSPQSTKLVANLPYYISTAILQRLAEQRECFSEIVLMFQREVVERITAEPGSSERGFLTVLVESTFDIKRLFDVPPEAFRPRPKIWSAVVRLVPKERKIGDSAFFRRLLSAAFAKKRKTILNNLKTFSAEASAALSTAGIEPSRRAESLTLAEWAALNEAFGRYA